MSDSNPPRVFGRRQFPVVAAPAAEIKQENQSLKTGNHKIVTLLRVQATDRDGRWNHEFANQVPSASFRELYPELLSPQGHRVYAVTVTAPDDPQAMKFPNLVKKATKAGLGLAIFTAPGMEPAFVFRHGQLTPVITDGRLMPLSTRPTGESGGSDIEEGSRYIAANPSPSVLPETTRAALREWLERCHGLTDVKILLRIAVDDPDQPIKTLGVLLPRRVMLAETLSEIMLGIYWYLPPDVASGQFSHADPQDYFPL